MSHLSFSRARGVASASGSLLAWYRAVHRSARLHAEGRFLEAYELAEHAADEFDRVVEKSRTIHGQPPSKDEETVKAAVRAASTGEILLQLGNYAKAIPALELTVRSFRDSGLNDPSHARAAIRAYRNLALAHKAVGDYPAGCVALERGLDVYEHAQADAKAALAKVAGVRLVDKLFGRDVDLVAVMLELADIYLLVDRRRDSDRMLARIERSIPGLPKKNQSPALLAMLLAKARLAHLDNRLDDAQELLNQASLIINGDVRWNTEVGVSWLRQAAGVLLSLGNASGAEDLYRKALQLVEQGYPDTNPMVAEVLFDLARAVAAGGRHEEAIGLLLEVCTRESILWQVLSVVAEAQRLRYLTRLKRELDALLSLIERADLGNTFAAAACQVLLRRKGASFEADLAQREAVFSNRYPQLRPSFERLSALRTRIGQKLLAGAGPEGAVEHERVLGRWQQERQELEADLMRMVPLPDLTRSLSATVAAVQHALPPNSALVEFYQYDESPHPGRYVAFVLDTNTRDCSVFWLGDLASVNTLVGEFRTMLDGSVPYKQRRRAAKAVEDLAARLLPPLRAARLKAHRLIIAPDGQLSGIPFELLPMAVASGGELTVAPFEIPLTKNVLLHHAQISYLTTGRDLCRLQRAASPGPLARPVVAGAPDYNLESEQRLARDPASPRLLMFFDDLEGTAEEATEVARMLRTTPLIGQHAVKSVIRRGPAPAILHLATHGYALAPIDVAASAAGRDFVQGSQDYVLRSGLALAGANTWCRGGEPPDKAEDGLLSAEDVLGMDLQGTDLVTLSACETGVGFPAAGEGTFGLRRSFLVAGARSLIVSLWKVPDTVTTSLMREFYRQLLLGKSKSESLRAAQAAVRDERSHSVNWSHPVNWAAFLLIGDTGPLALSRSSWRALRA